MRISLALLAVLLLVPATAHAAGAGDIKVTATKQVSARQTSFTVQTPALNFPAEVRVLLPADYGARPKRRYPVLYLFHGSFDNAASWTDKGDVENITAGQPLIVVMPQAAGTGQGGGWASDWRNEGRDGPPEWETFTIGELIPWVQAHYRTRANRPGRAIAGLSMGGFTAMSYAARHPDLFASAASFSGAVDTNNQEVQPVIELETLADGGTTPDAIWGPRATDEVYWRAHNPWDLAANLHGMQLSIRTGNGQQPEGSSGPPDPVEAGVHDMSVSLDARLTALKIRHVFEDYGAGTHSWPYWQKDLRKDLPRFMATFAHPGRAVPKRFSYTSAEPSFRVYGWRVVMKRAAVEFASLEGAGRRGFTLTGSGSATVTTRAAFRPRSRHRVTIGSAKPHTIRADRRGRLTIVAPLGDSNPLQQYTPGATTTVHKTRVKIGPAPRGR